MKILSLNQVRSPQQYSLVTKTEGPYILLKYNQLESDLSNPVVQELRGKIFRLDTGKAVCVPFPKFFNYGEPNAAQIEWSKAVVMEKIDGSLMKAWWDEGIWHLSTNGTINAFTTPVSDCGITFGELFEHTTGMTLSTFMGDADHGRTYMFELVAPENKLVVRYDESALYYLGAHLNETGEFTFEGDFPNVKLPHRFALHNLEECLTATATMTQDEEGFVVWDGINRIKVKSPAYLAAAHLYNNGAIGFSRILRLLLDGTADDLVGMFPEYGEKVEKVRRAFLMVREEANLAYDALHNKPRREIALSPYADYVFKRIDGKTENVDSYYRSISFSNLEKIIKEKMTNE